MCLNTRRGSKQEVGQLSDFKSDFKSDFPKACLHNGRFQQCWTVGAMFTFGRSRMFGPDKLRPLAVGRSQSRRIKNVKNML